MRSKTNILKKFINCIYNVDEFPKYIREGIGKAIFYALLLSVFIGGVKGIKEIIIVDSYIKESVNLIKGEDNQFLIKDNQLTLKNSPVNIENNGILLYADDKLELNDLSKLKSITVNEDLSFLFLKDGLYIKENVNDIKGIGDIGEIYYSSLNIEGQIDNEDLIESIQSTKSVLYLVVVVFCIINEFLMYIIASFFIAILTFIPSRLWKVRLPLSSLFSLSVYAYTLPNLLVLILSILIPNVLFDTAGMVGALVYTYLAIRSIKKEINEKVV